MSNCETANIKKIAEEVPPNPCAGVAVNCKNQSDVKDAFLVIEKVICRIPHTDLPLVLLASCLLCFQYALTIHAESCNNIYFFLRLHYWRKSTLGGRPTLQLC